MPKPKGKSRRKKEGAFYTPAFITRYIVGQRLGRVLADHFADLRARHEQQASSSARPVLADPNVYDLAILKKPQLAALVRFWEEWQDELESIRVLDPACGSGAFLIEAFDQLYAAFQASNDRLAELTMIWRSSEYLSWILRTLNHDGLQSSIDIMRMTRSGLRKMWLSGSRRTLIRTTSRRSRRIQLLTITSEYGLVGRTGPEGARA